MRITGRDRVLVARTVHPEYREVLRTYAQHQGMPVEEFGYDAEIGQIDLADLERKLDEQTAAVIIQSPNFFGIVENVEAGRRAGAREGRAAGLRFHRSGVAGVARAAARRRYRRGRTAIVRHLAELRRAVCGHHRGEGKIHAPDARTPGGRDERYARQSRILPDAGDARAAHPAREGDVEYLHQSGADRADGDRVHDASTASRVCANWPTQNLVEGALSGGEIEAAIQRAVLQRVRGEASRTLGGAINERCWSEEDHRRTAAGTFLSGTQNAVLLCCTEMTKRADMDQVAEVFA